MKKAILYYFKKDYQPRTVILKKDLANLFLMTMKGKINVMSVRNV